MKEEVYCYYCVHSLLEQTASATDSRHISTYESTPDTNTTHTLATVDHSNHSTYCLIAVVSSYDGHRALHRPPCTHRLAL